MANPTSRKIEEITRELIAFTTAILFAATTLSCATDLEMSLWGSAMAKVPLATGTSRTFDADVDHAIAAISDALREAHFDQHLNCNPKPSKTFPECYPLTIERVDDSTSVINATKIRRGFYSGWTGTQARFVIHSNSPTRTTVTVLSMYRNRILLGREDYSREFVKTIEKELRTRPD